MSDRNVTVALLERFTRPDAERFTHLTPEYFRWFDAERAPRPRPLDADELIEFLMQQEGCDYDAAEFAVALDSQAGLLDQDLWAELQAAGLVDAIANSD